MPDLNIIRAAVAELADGPPLVAALPGGTTGIGSYVAKALALTFARNGSKLRVYIVGRNAARAETLITECKRISPDSEWRFVQATDLALISEVDRSCAEIIRHETEAPFHGGPVRLDLLYMSHCHHILAKPVITKEGLDAFISTVYYSRIRFITQLMPLLTASPLPGNVVSIYAGGFEDGTSPGEFPVGTPPPSEYGIGGVRKHATFMKTFMFEEFAERNAGRLRLTHIYPGLVDGPAFYSDLAPTWMRVVWAIFKPLLKVVYMTKPDDCGQVMVYLATSRYPAKGETGKDAKVYGGVKVAMSTKAEFGGGSYGAGQRGDIRAKGKAYEKVRTPTTSKQVWEHTMELLDGIAEKNGKAS